MAESIIITRAIESKHRVPMTYEKCDPVQVTPKSFATSILLIVTALNVRINLMYFLCHASSASIRSVLFCSSVIMLGGAAQLSECISSADRRCQGARYFGIEASNHAQYNVIDLRENSARAIRLWSGCLL